MCHEPTPQEQNVSHGDTSTLELVTLLNALYFAVLEIPLKRDAMDKIFMGEITFHAICKRSLYEIGLV